MAPLWPRLAAAIIAANADGGSVMDALMNDFAAEQEMFEREFGELVHQDLRKQAEQANKPGGEIGSLLEEISSAAVHEIDTLISELRVTRERLVIEGERVHRELAGYAALSHSTIQATRIIADSLNHSKQLDDSPSIAMP
jgi:hypothetical protein